MNLEEFNYTLKEYDRAHLVFVALGNELRNDDASGLVFLRALIDSGIYRDSHFIEAERNPENYLEVILRYNPSAVVFIDASSGNGISGEIKWLHPDETSASGFSTHTYSIKLIEQYLSASKNIDFFYLGIQADNLKEGSTLSPAVKKNMAKFFNGTGV